MTWSASPLGEISQPKQWPTLSKAQLAGAGNVVFGANGPIGFSALHTHVGTTILIACRGTCGAINVAEGQFYANGNAMALDALDSSRVDVYFLARFLAHRGLRDVVTGSSQPQITRQNLVRISIPLPPLPEQRRIAAILSQADDLRTKCGRALTFLHELAEAIYIDMFEGPHDWPKTRLEDILSLPLRNGISPSTGGGFDGRVLTLAAITHGEYDSSASKAGTFDRPHDVHKTVAAGELLICRGNGNSDLVGRAELVDHTDVSLAFPDTMIAARFNGRSVDGAYVKAAWNRPTVRAQIQAGSRTTNGTFKINQQTLNAIELAVPPLQLQRDFALRIRSIDALRVALSARNAQIAELFATLQHRAFRGEL